MKEAIENRLIIQIDMLPNWDSIYCGICLLSNDQVILMLNFNHELGEFDGFSILKNKDLSKYRFWDSEDYAQLKNDNSAKFIHSIAIEDFSDIKSALSNLTNELISIFTYVDTESYYVGQIEKINKNSIDLKLLDENAEWLETEKFDFDEISYIGFRTNYEFELIDNVV